MYLFGKFILNTRELFITDMVMIETHLVAHSDVDAGICLAQCFVLVMMEFAATQCIVIPHSDYLLNNPIPIHPKEILHVTACDSVSHLNN